MWKQTVVDNFSTADHWNRNLPDRNKQEFCETTKFMIQESGTWSLFTTLLIYFNRKQRWFSVESSLRAGLGLISSNSWYFSLCHRMQPGFWLHFVSLRMQSGRTWSHSTHVMSSIIMNKVLGLHFSPISLHIAVLNQRQGQWYTSVFIKFKFFLQITVKLLKKNSETKIKQDRIHFTVLFTFTCSFSCFPMFPLVLWIPFDKRIFLTSVRWVVKFVFPAADWRRLFS